MKIKGKYKIARRLGAQIFDKTSSAKFARRESEKTPASGKRRGRSRSDFASQLIEKQRARYMYGITEKQFRNYVRSVLERKGMNHGELLFGKLERRLDNTVYRLGFAPTRQAARQMVSHGHITINGQRVYVPSLQVNDGDTIAIRSGSRNKVLFVGLEDRLKEREAAAWLALDASAGQAKVQGSPKWDPAVLPFDIEVILEFYRR